MKLQGRTELPKAWFTTVSNNMTAKQWSQNYKRRKIAINVAIFSGENILRRLNWTTFVLLFSIKSKTAALAISASEPRLCAAVERAVSQTANKSEIDALRQNNTAQRQDFNSITPFW